jgi:hypothetical protein
MSGLPRTITEAKEGENRRSKGDERTRNNKAKWQSGVIEAKWAVWVTGPDQGQVQLEVRELEVRVTKIFNLGALCKLR